MLLMAKGKQAPGSKEFQYKLFFNCHVFYHFSSNCVSDLLSLYFPFQLSEKASLSKSCFKIHKIIWNKINSYTALIKELPYFLHLF